MMLIIEISGGVWKLVTVQHCLSAVMRVWSFINCVLLMLNVSSSSSSSNSIRPLRRYHVLGHLKISSKYYSNEVKMSITVEGCHVTPCTLIMNIITNGWYRKWKQDKVKCWTSWYTNKSSRSSAGHFRSLMQWCEVLAYLQIWRSSCFRRWHQGLISQINTFSNV